MTLVLPHQPKSLHENGASKSELASMVGGCSGARWFAPWMD
ncbi:hypothetical protein MMEU_0851 [Mycobacterium marinum str. Europe]|nr:hypothetical protein MMEU_0851 [Mycobacterium marinum str. Europe]